MNALHSNNEKATVKKVVRQGLCTGCGTCAGICPHEAIEMVVDSEKGIYLPTPDTERCFIKCRLCFDACPGYTVDFRQLNGKIFGKESEDILLGNYRNCYIGHATDYDIRYNSASGGLVTALLIYALEEGMIDGALVTRMKRDKPLEPEPFIARSREEIIEASKSKYCPVPANIALREILKTEGKYAVVGLPCHIHGVRKAETLNKRLTERIVLHLGIFCGHTPTFLGTKFLLWRGDVKEEDVIKLSYRGEGWPGRVLLQSKDGKKIFYPYNYLWSRIFGRFFYPMRCTLCCDQSSELADISFGDAWLPELANDNVGTSVVISRTEVGEALLQNTMLKKKVNLNETAAATIKRSQNHFSFKKSLKARSSFLRLFRHSLPVYNIELPQPKAAITLLTPLFYFDLHFSSKRHLWALLSFYISLRSFTGKLLRHVRTIYA